MTSGNEARDTAGRSRDVGDRVDPVGGQIVGLTVDGDDPRGWHTSQIRQCLVAGVGATHRGVGRDGQCRTHGDGQTMHSGLHRRMVGYEGIDDRVGIGPDVGQIQMAERRDVTRRQRQSVTVGGTHDRVGAGTGDGECGPETYRLARQGQTAVGEQGHRHAGRQGRIDHRVTVGPDVG